jgi:hypothetical protein
MRRNLLYVGVLLFVIGILVVIFAFPSAMPSNVITPLQKQLLINSSGMGYVQFTLNQTGLVEALFRSSAPVDFYFANTTAFNKIYGAGVANGSARMMAISLQGDGVYEVYEDTLDGAFPFNYTNVTEANYLQENVSLLQSGAYYAIFSNINNGTAGISLLYATANSTALRSAFDTMSLYGLSAVFLFLAGLACIAASFFLKVKQPIQPKPEEKMDADAQKMYDSIEKKG